MLMASYSLPPGCRIRKAKFTDLPQLILQIFESKSFVAYLEMKNWFLLILVIAAFIGYRIGFNFAKDLYLNSSSSKIQTLLQKIFYDLIKKLYESETDYYLSVDKIASRVGNVFAIVFILITIIFLTALSLRSLYLQTWVIENNNQIIASARFNIYISRLDNLYVKPQYRRQGIASYLIKYLQKQFNKSIYITCYANLVNFFEHIGFIKVLGNEQQVAFGKAKNQIYLYFPKESIELTAIETRILFKQQIDKCSIRHANKEDIESIGKLNLLNQTMDYFLPFGTNFIWAGKIIGWGLRFACWQFIFLNYEIITITTLYQSYDVIISLFYSNIFLCSVVFTLVFISESNKYDKLQKYPLFILLEYDKQIIGYVRFLKQRKYYILNHVYLPTSLEPEIMTYFIQQIIDLIAQPMLIACTKQEEQFYRNIGFLRIHTEKLPKKLRLGGWLNELFGGINLVYVSRN
jgi:N-acetylglutamate synthase-like GNAT family acetyltransferase